MVGFLEETVIRQYIFNKKKKSLHLSYAFVNIEEAIYLYMKFNKDF